MVPVSDTTMGAPVAAARNCILVVEDEFLIRMIVSDELRDAGFDVIEACNADEALTIIRSPVPVELIISDVRMPGSLDGLGLLAEIRAISPTLPVIITSGHLEPRFAAGATRFLGKPYALDVIIGAVREELARAK